MTDINTPQTLLTKMRYPKGDGYYPYTSGKIMETYKAAQQSAPSGIQLDLSCDAVEAFFKSAQMHANTVKKQMELTKPNKETIKINSAEAATSISVAYGLIASIEDLSMDIFHETKSAYTKNILETIQPHLPRDHKLV
jgi:hypothetical protein